MIHAALINGTHSNADPNEHQITLTVRCQEEDKLAVIRIMHEAVAQLGVYDPELKAGDMILKKDTQNIHPIVLPSKKGEQPN